jgi:uncharacterized short protein YbdD (DUF466 family)
MLNELSQWGSYLGQTARLMVGLPNYDTYVQHHQAHHPDKPVMSYEEFFIERQKARYDGSKRVGCC